MPQACCDVACTTLQALLLNAAHVATLLVLQFQQQHLNHLNAQAHLFLRVPQDHHLYAQPKTVHCLLRPLRHTISTTQMPQHKPQTLGQFPVKNNWQRLTTQRRALLVTNRMHHQRAPASVTLLWN